MGRKYDNSSVFFPFIWFLAADISQSKVLFRPQSENLFRPFEVGAKIPPKKEEGAPKMKSQLAWKLPFLLKNVHLLKFT